MPIVYSKYNFGYSGTDREGRPFYYDCPGAVKVENILDVISLGTMEKYYMLEYEKLLHIRLPACEKAAGRTIDTTFSVLDMKGFSMTSLNSKTKDFVMSAIVMGQNYYPEIMHEMIIINAPFIFRAAYAIFKPFINEKTRNKMFVKGENYHKDVFSKVDPSNVPAFMGGELEDLKEHGPWMSGYEGDVYGEEAKRKLREMGEEGKSEEGKSEEDPDENVGEKSDRCSSTGNISIEDDDISVVADKIHRDRNQEWTFLPRKSHSKVYSSPYPIITADDDVDPEESLDSDEFHSCIEGDDFSEQPFSNLSDQRTRSSGNASS